MYLEPNIAAQKGLLRWSKYLLGSVLILAIGVLSGWLLNIAFLERPFLGLPAMGPLTALAFICSSLFIILLSSEEETNTRIKIILSRALVLIVLLIVILKMVQLVSGSMF